MSLIINKVKNCQNQKMKKKRNKVKSKKEKENEKLKGRQNNSYYRCHRNCKNHPEFESHLQVLKVFLCVLILLQQMIF